MFLMHDEDGYYEAELVEGAGWGREPDGTVVILCFPVSDRFSAYRNMPGQWPASLSQPMTPAAREMIAIARSRR